MMTCLPHRSESFCPTARATTSDTPPGAAVTKIVAGRLGKDCACADGMPDWQRSAIKGPSQFAMVCPLRNSEQAFQPVRAADAEEIKNSPRWERNHTRPLGSRGLVRHAGFRKGRHAGMASERSAQQQHRQRGARGFAQTHVKIDERF